MFIADSFSLTRCAIQFDAPEKCQHAIQQLVKADGRYGGVLNNKSVINGRATWRDSVDAPGLQLTKLNELTLVFDVRNQMGPKATAIAEIVNPMPTWEKDWGEHQDHQLVAAVQMEQALKARMLQGGRESDLSGGFPLQAVSPLIQNTSWAVAGIGLLDQAKVDLVAECDTPDDAEKVAKTLQALMSLAANIVGEQEAATLANIAQSKDPKQASVKPVAESAFKIASEFLNKAEPKADGQQVRLAFAYPIDEAELAIATGLLIPALDSAKAAGPTN